MQLPSFMQFKKFIFNKLTEQEVASLSYLSLFDLSTWEQVEKPSYLPNFNKSREKVLSIFEKKSGHFYNKYIVPDKNEFYKQFVESEILTNYLLVAQIDGKAVDNTKIIVDKPSLTKKVFPDIILKSNIDVALEVKGLVSASNLFDRVKREVIKPLKVAKNQKYDKFILILLFPILKKENCYRISQLVEGYYAYETIIKNEVKLDCNVLCQCCSLKWQKNYSFENLGERLLEIFNK